jgi:diaminohydroxyphosphoribosylaminopyrimidine deaminase/5-amino-6-(5-phosphoribosylamino)uracil reductase
LTNIQTPCKGYLRNLLRLSVTIHQQYMYRCLQLAKQGAGHVALNPMVGAVLVYNERIIGEGYHQKFGEAHAEVNCINKALSNCLNDLTAISRSTLYVSLEPCAHFGKTPPCADLIIKHKIPKVVIGCRDPFKEVDGKGIEKLEAAGVEVVTGVLEEDCKDLNRRFFTFHTKKRPYIILKWAETADGKISLADGQRLHISNEYTNRLVHKWRSEEAAILVGTNTVIDDDPELTTRLWPGNSPVRMIVDMNLRVPASLKIFNGQTRTIIFNSIKHEESGSLLYYQVSRDVSLVQQVVNALYQLNIQSVIVEGGAKLLQSFIDEGMWDEARVIRNTELVTGRGLEAPVLKNYNNAGVTQLFDDRISIYSKALI